MMTPNEIYRAAVRIYTQGTPCTPTIAVEIARKMAREVESYNQAHQEAAPGAQAVIESIEHAFGGKFNPPGAAHGVADQEETE